jgi:hypothetical protein
MNRLFIIRLERAKAPIREYDDSMARRRGAERLNVLITTEDTECAEPSPGTFSVISVICLE